MHRAQSQVFEFHKLFEHPAPTRFTMESFRASLRAGLILEEAEEFIEATGLEPVRDETGKVTEWKKVREPDPVEMIDALCDLLYVTYGAAVEMGVSLEPFYDEVHRSNMAKAGPDGKPIRRPDGKTLKPAGWQPPDIKKMLNALMEREAFYRQQGLED